LTFAWIDLMDLCFFFVVRDCRLLCFCLGIGCVRLQLQNKYSKRRFTLNDASMVRKNEESGFAFTNCIKNKKKEQNKKQNKAIRTDFCLSFSSESPPLALRIRNVHTEHQQTNKQKKMRKMVSGWFANSLFRQGHSSLILTELHLARLSCSALSIVNPNRPTTSCSTSRSTCFVLHVRSFSQQQGIEDAEALKLRKRSGIFNMNAARKASENGHVDLALGFFDKSKQDFSHELFLPEWMEVMGDIGQVHMKRGDLDKAYPYFQQAFDAASRETHPLHWGQLSYLMGMLLSQRKQGDDIKRAIVLLEQSLDSGALNHLPTRQSAALCYATLGQLFSGIRKDVNDDNTNKAINYLKKCLQVSSALYTPDDIFNRKIAEKELVNLMGTRAFTNLTISSSESTEKAIEDFEYIRLLIDPSHFNWAPARMNLALLFNRRTKGDVAENQD
jgi:tetratricopeptide (TPR) repeat protein